MNKILIDAEAPMPDPELKQGQIWKGKETGHLYLATNNCYLVDLEDGKATAARSNYKLFYTHICEEAEITIRPTKL